jgi:anti-sigma regulatory factor (Ser/Thr protein kinase)
MDAFLSGTTGFLREGVAAGEAALVVVSADKIRKLRRALGADADAVFFADMADVGANPARIIPAWRRFADDQTAAGRPFRGIGEPIYPERSADALVECQRHEDLLNVAFEGGAGWWLLCPYDLTALPSHVIEEAHRSHPFIMEGSTHRPSDVYRGLDAFTSPYDPPLPEPPGNAIAINYDGTRLALVRGVVTAQAIEAGLSDERIDDIVFAVNELASNSLRHGGGGGRLRIWDTPTALVCEVTDRGFIDEPLVGRFEPSHDALGGRGLWLVNHLCDLVQVRSNAGGTTIRLHTLH